MKVAIIGFGVEGQSALQYWQEQGADVTVCDQDPNKQVPDGATKQLGERYLDDLGRFDIIVRTVGMHPQTILDKDPGVKGKLTTNINEFMRVCPTKNVIGVTGTKGKGTTCTLILKMLEAAGKHAFLGGNYGVPAFSFLGKLTPESWVVMELSSFMLFDIKHSPRTAVCLMVVPEHLDWHQDRDDYFTAKSNLFKHQTKGDIAIYYAKNDISKQIASSSPGRKIGYFEPPGALVKDNKIVIEDTQICDVKDVKLLGAHNLQNICAAITAVWQSVPNAQAMRKVITTFTGLPNRLEFVRELDGVKYYNDSFGSDPYATEAAMAAFPGKKVMIIGGYDGRKIPLEHLAQTIAERHASIRSVIAIGQGASRLADALAAAKAPTPEVCKSQNIKGVVKAAQTAAQTGDVVVFSPGFPSFDMFKNFEDRGEQFRQTVKKL